MNDRRDILVTMTDLAVGDIVECSNVDMTLLEAGRIYTVSGVCDVGIWIMELAGSGPWPYDCFKYVTEQDDGQLLYHVL